MLGPDHPYTRKSTSALEVNEMYLANPRVAAAHQQRRQQLDRQKVKAAGVRARVLTVASNPELSGTCTAVHVLKYKHDKGRCVIMLHPELGDAATKSLCSPASLVGLYHVCHHVNVPGGYPYPCHWFLFPFVFPCCCAQYTSMYRLHRWEHALLLLPYLVL